MKILATLFLLVLGLPLAGHAEDLTTRTALELRDQLRAGTTTAEAVTQAFLDRIAAIDDAFEQATHALKEPAFLPSIEP